MTAPSSPSPKERPIIFSGPMVRAILTGTKTQTRRVLSNQDPFDDFESLPPLGLKCPYGCRGEHLWVKETWQRFGNDDIVYKATDDCDPLNSWKSPLFMPRSASRITLEITGICIERLQNISVEDAFWEGVALKGRRGSDQDPRYIDTARYAFMRLWDSINGERPGNSWAANPWVWVISFKLLDTLP